MEKIDNNFTKIGYCFVGWEYNETIYNDKQSVINLTIEAGAELVFTAQWEENTYTIVFDGNGADEESSMSNQSVVFGQATALNNNAFTKEGHTFDAVIQSDPNVPVLYWSGRMSAFPEGILQATDIKRLILN